MRLIKKTCDEQEDPFSLVMMRLPSRHILSTHFGRSEEDSFFRLCWLTGLRRRKSSNVVDQAYDTVERKGRRSPRGVSGLNYK